MKNSKSEWISSSESLFSDCIEYILNKIHCNTIRVELDNAVFNNPNLGGACCSVDTYKHTQKYNFGIDNSDAEITKIRVYQEDMCKVYSGTYMELKTSHDINSPYLVKSIVAFLMAHIVWK